MAERRTRSEKIIAEIRRREKIKFPLPSVKLNSGMKTNIVLQFSGTNLPVELVTTDLTKSLAVTILALILQFALAGYLDRGGWQDINNVLHGIFTIY
jgi:hypothetical protein